MSKQSEAVKIWRRRTKDRIVKSMGSKCYVCGYDKCNAAFDLHHLNPNMKEFSFGGVKANPISWARIVIELRKCVLLCANCHREVESKFIELPIEIKSTFNESFVEYDLGAELKRRVPQIVYCRQCGIELITNSSRHKYCSDVCRKIFCHYSDIVAQRKSSRPRKTVWPEKEVLAEMIKEMTWVDIAKKYKVSDTAVRKWAKSYKLI